jgi:DNA-binding transcriptional regulator LsrR (DeoR family)
MAYTTDPEAYDEHLLRRIAQLVYVEHRKHEEILNLQEAKNLGILNRAQISAICEAAKRAGIVLTVVRDRKISTSDRLNSVANELKEKFKLLDCKVVPGDLGILEKDNLNSQPAVRELIVSDIARMAAGLIDEFFEKDVDRSRVMATTFGSMARKVADSLSPHKWHAGDRWVLAAVGPTVLKHDRLSANNIARVGGKLLGCNYRIMPVPAVVDRKAVTKVKEIPLVKEMVGLLNENVNTVLTTVGAPMRNTILDSLTEEAKKEETRCSTLLYEKTRKGPAVGNCGGRLFDAEGEELPYGTFEIIGMELKQLTKLVKEGKPVIIATGADFDRIPAIRVAIGCRRPFGSILVTDETTASVLLDKQPLPTD